MLNEKRPHRGYAPGESPRADLLIESAWCRAQRMTVEQARDALLARAHGGALSEELAEVAVRAILERYWGVAPDAEVES